MSTPLLGLPEIAEAQKSKYLTHNEALRALEAVLTAVESLDTAAEPANPPDGLAHIIPANATGATWATLTAGQVAVAVGGGWLALTPSEGLSVWVKDKAARYDYLGGAWVKSAAGLGDPPANSEAALLGSEAGAYTTQSLAHWAAAARALLSAPTPPTGSTDPFGATHWKLVIDRTWGGPGVQIGDLELRETAGVAEAMPSASAFASSVYGTDPTKYQAAAAFDGQVVGDGTTEWASDDAQTLPQDVGLVFATARDVLELRVRYASNINWDVRDARLRYSLDQGATWHTRQTYTDLVQQTDFVVPTTDPVPGPLTDEYETLASDYGAIINLKCDETSGTTMADSAGGDDDFTAPAAATDHVAGVDQWNWYDLAGQSTGLARADAPLGTGTIAAATFECWCWLVSDAGYNVLFTHYAAATADVNMYVAIRPDRAIQCQVFPGNNHHILTPANTVQLNRWHHIVFTHDSSAGYRVYLDGTDAGSWAGAESYGGPAADRVLIGAYATGNVLQGRVRRARVYPSVLSAGQVAALHAAGLKPPSEALSAPAGPAVNALGVAGGEHYTPTNAVENGTQSGWTAFNLPDDVSVHAALITGYAALRGTGGQHKHLELAGDPTGKGMQRLGIEDANGECAFALPISPGQREIYYRVAGAMTDVDIVISGAVG